MKQAGTDLLGPAPYRNNYRGPSNRRTEGIPGGAVQYTYRNNYRGPSNRRTEGIPGGAVQYTSV